MTTNRVLVLLRSVASSTPRIAAIRNGPVAIVDHRGNPREEGTLQPTTR